MQKRRVDPVSIGVASHPSSPVHSPGDSPGDSSGDSSGGRGSRSGRTVPFIKSVGAIETQESKLARLKRLRRPSPTAVILEYIRDLPELLESHHSDQKEPVVLDIHTCVDPTLMQSDLAFSSTPALHSRVYTRVQDIRGFDPETTTAQFTYSLWLTERRRALVALHARVLYACQVHGIEHTSYAESCKQLQLSPSYNRKCQVIQKRLYTDGQVSSPLHTMLFGVAPIAHLRISQGAHDVYKSPASCDQTLPWLLHVHLECDAHSFDLRPYQRGVLLLDTDVLQYDGNRDPVPEDDKADFSVLPPSVWIVSDHIEFNPLYMHTVCCALQPTCLDLTACAIDGSMAEWFNDYSHIRRLRYVRIRVRATNNVTDADYCCRVIDCLPVSCETIEIVGVNFKHSSTQERWRTTRFNQRQLHIVFVDCINIGDNDIRIISERGVRGASLWNAKIE